MRGGTGHYPGRKQSRDNINILQNSCFSPSKFMVIKLFNASIQQYFEVILIKYKYEKKIVKNNCGELSKQKIYVTPVRRDEAFIWKNRPVWAGIPVAESEIPPRRDGTKNVPGSYKRNAINIIETYTCRDLESRSVLANVPSRLPYKQPVTGAPICYWTTRGRLYKKVIKVSYD